VYSDLLLSEETVMLFQLKTM